jgi:isopenicillin N synthase-like dioxygenase
MAEILKDEDLRGLAAFDRANARNAPQGPRRRALARLPVIDLSAFCQAGSEAERARVAREIHQASVDIGFFYVTGHGFTDAELRETLDWGLRFFNLPVATKMTIDAKKSPKAQGYIRTGGINPEGNPDKAPDLKERLMLAREVDPGEPAEGRYAAGGSQWPDPALLPGFEPYMKEQIRKRLTLTRQLARAFAVSLDLREDIFDAAHKHPGSTFSFNYYPPIDLSTVTGTQWSFSPHTDYGTFTILVQDDLGGLQARNADGEWIDVPPIDGTLVINVGDILMRWTNDLYISSLHRALNLNGAARISAPFFVQPNGRTEIRCLETCHDAANPPRYAPVMAADYITALVEQSRRTGRVGISTRTAERFET